MTFLPKTNNVSKERGIEDHYTSPEKNRLSLLDEPAFLFLWWPFATFPWSTRDIERIFERNCRERKLGFEMRILSGFGRFEAFWMRIFSGF